MPMEDSINTQEQFADSEVRALCQKLTSLSSRINEVCEKAHALRAALQYGYAGADFNFDFHDLTLSPAQAVSPPQVEAH